MKTKNPSKKKRLLHFTLAVGLIVGIWITANVNSNPSSGSSDSFSENYYPADTLDADEQNLANYKNEETADFNPETEISDVILEVAIDKISSLRYDFNVEDPNEVRNIQRILGLEEDGIFGPKTQEGYSLAITEDEARKLTLAKDSKEEPVILQPEKEIPAVVLTPTSNLTTLNIKTTVPGNNTMLD